MRLVVVALGVFCFLPRCWLRSVRYMVSSFAVTALCLTFGKMYTDWTLVNGADHGALVLRTGLVAILCIMLMEANGQSGSRR